MTHLYQTITPPLQSSGAECTGNLADVSPPVCMLTARVRVGADGAKVRWKKEDVLRWNG